MGYTLTMDRFLSIVIQICIYYMRIFLLLSFFISFTIYYIKCINKESIKRTILENEKRFKDILEDIEKKTNNTK